MMLLHYFLMHPLHTRPPHPHLLTTPFLLEDTLPTHIALLPELAASLCAALRFLLDAGDAAGSAVALA